MDRQTKAEIRAKITVIDMIAEKVDEATEELAAENDRLREALEWYAERDNYRSYRLDLGLRARAALKQE